MPRVVFLVDMNAFFISCEMLRHPELRGIPAAVAGDPAQRTGIILAANYDARAFGVKTAMPLHQALKLCPGLATVAPDHRYYEDKSGEVMSLLARYSPVVEQNSIDEAWLDMTGSDGLFGSPRQCAERIMTDLRENLGLWCSIGIASNKFLAKMASDMKKPLGITEIGPEDIAGKLWPLPVRAMYGVGGKTAERLRGIGVETIGDLARLEPDFVHRLFGKAGHELHAHANGLDDAPVQPHQSDEMKQIGRSVTLPRDIGDLEQARRVLLRLSDEIGRSARSHGKKGRTVQITLKYADFTVANRQGPVPETWTTQVIYETACGLLERNWDPAKPVRLIGIALSGLDGEEKEEPHQLSLLDAMPLAGEASKSAKAFDRSDEKKNERLDVAMDRIRLRLGSDAVGRASLLRRPVKASPEDAESGTRRPHMPGGNRE